MVDTGELESYLSFKSCKSGDIVTIKGEGEIELNQDGQKILNLPVEVNQRTLIYSPGKQARTALNKMFKSTDTKDWVSKQFKVSFVKMSIKGELKDVIIPIEL